MSLRTRISLAAAGAVAVIAILLGAIGYFPTRARLVDQVRAQLQERAASLVTSRADRDGMVLVEALAAGTPVIACSTGAIPEVLGADGTLVAAGDWLGIAQALGDAVAGAPAARVEADRARLERFSSAAAAERLRAVYAELLETGARRSAPRARRGSRRAPRPRTGAGARRGRGPGRGRRPG